MAGAPTIPGERGGRFGADGELNRLESQEARRLGLPRPDLTRLSMIGSAGMPWENGVLLSDEAIVTGSNSVAHNLGRTPSGMMVVKDLAPPCYVEAYLNAAQSLTNNAETTVQYDTEIHDFGGRHASGVVTIPHTGKYRIRATAYLNYDLTAGTDRYMNMLCSSAGNIYSAYFRDGPEDKTIIDSTEIITLTAGETMQIKIFQNTGASVPLLVGTRANNRLIVESDDSRSEGVHDSTNLTIWSARSRTMSFWVW